MSDPASYFDTARRTELWYNLPQHVLSRKPWHYQKSARDIRPQRVYVSSLAGGLFNSGHALLMGGDAWIIQPYGHDPAELLTTEGQSHVEGTDLLLAPNHRSFYTYRQTTTPGADQAGNLLMQAAPAFQRRRAAAGLLSDGNLDADLSAYPAPTDPGHGPGGIPLIPSDRVASGLVTYPPNQPYRLEFKTVSGSQEQVCCFYFGGGAEVRPAGQSGGQFALTLRADGGGILREHDDEETVGDPWKPVFEFPWGHKHAVSVNGAIENNNLFVVPYGRDRMGFYNLGAGYSGMAGTGQGFMMQGLLGTLAGLALTAVEARLPVPIRVLKHHSAVTDHRHLAYMTGPGTIRMDRSRTDRLPFSIVHLKYRQAATLIDAPFKIDVGTIPLATHLTLTTSGYAPAGTEIVAEIFDATTNVRLLRSGNFWLTNANQNHYYVKFTFNSAGDPDAVPPVAAGEQTPVLFGYSVSCPPGEATVELSPTRITDLHEVNVIGCGAALGEENASVKIVDPTNVTGLLRFRDQMKAKLVVCNRATGVPIGVLFEGQTNTPHATLRGFQDGLAYPDPDWHDTDTKLTGLWPRLFRQFSTQIFPFGDSKDSPHPLASTESDWGYAPWRLTDLLRWAFNQAGVPDSQLDIPDSPLRFPIVAGLKPEDYTVQPGTPFGQFIEALAKDFLGQLLIRDPNSGPVDSSGLPAGMWRLLVNPSLSSTNYLFTINADAPANIGVPYFPMVEGGMGTQVYPIQPGSWATWPRAAEGNVVVTRGFADGGTDNGGQMLQSDPVINPAGFDPGSPDWLEGDTVMIVRVFEGFPMDLAALNWAARVIYQRACVAEKWWQAVIPCPLFFDPLDVPGPQVAPRPPRINDLVRVKRNGTLYPAVIRSANLAYDRDDFTWLALEGKFRDPAYTPDS